MNSYSSFYEISGIQFGGKGNIESTGKLFRAKFDGRLHRKDLVYFAVAQFQHFIERFDYFHKSGLK